MKVAIKKYISIANGIRMTIGTIASMAILVPVALIGVYAFEYLTPSSFWFHYDEVVSAKPEFRQGKVLKFHSIAEIKRHMKIQWQDTLYCSNGSFQTPYETQILPSDDPKWIEPQVYTEAQLDDIERAWTYTKEEIRLDEEECRMCGTVVGFTPKFNIEKPQSYGCSDWFGVNK